MGVKGLETFINENCPHAMQRVSIIEMANDHRKHHRVTPELVIDGMALIQTLYCGKLEWVYGGQWLEYAEEIKAFVDFFTKEHVKLVFFFDGSILESKRPEWTKRRLQKCKEIADTFAWLKNSRIIPENHQKFLLPTSMGHLTSLAVRLLCPAVEVHASVGDCDVEIATYARHSKAAFAILSNDTDFIIFDSKPYCTLKGLNRRTMETHYYDRSVLSCYLRLEQLKFPLFSCLMGNDFVSRDSLKQFHFYLRNEARGETRLAVLVANFMKRKGWWGNYENREELLQISWEIWKNNRMVDILYQSIKMYVDLQSPLQPQSIEERRHVQCINSPFIYTVCVNQVNGAGEVMEDITDQTIPPVNLVYRPIRQRVYYILLKNGESYSPGTQNTVVKEWCVYHGNKMREAELVSILPLKTFGRIPCLESLWNDAPFTTKYNCFMACLEIPLTEEQMLRLEPKYAIFSCIMNYLMLYGRVPMMNTFEVAAFISQAVCLSYKSPCDIRQISVSHIETRAIHLASMFMRGVSTMILALGASGYPFSCEDAMPWNFFDGKLFHKKYIEAKHGASHRDLCEQQEEGFSLFKQLQSAALCGVH